jgi:hypothetical protein
MDTLYQKLNKKLDTLIKHTNVTYNTEKNTHTHTQLSLTTSKITDIKFTKEKKVSFKTVQQTYTN